MPEQEVNNFWNDIGVGVPVEHAEEEVDPALDERPLSYLDIEPAPVARLAETPKRQLIELCKANPKDETGDLLSTLARNIGESPERTLSLLKELRREGRIDIVEAPGIRPGASKRLFSIHHLTQRSQAPTGHPAVVQCAAPGPDPVEQVSEEKLAAAIAEAMWLRYEQTLLEVGRLTEENDKLRCAIGDPKRLHDLAKDMLR